MPATVTNKSLNTASVNNRSIADVVWDSSLFAWDSPIAGWDSSTTFQNKSLNTGTMTNRALS